jgi:hypothetical protein
MTANEKVEYMNKLAPILNAVGLVCEINGQFDTAHSVKIWHPNWKICSKLVSFQEIADCEETLATILEDIIVRNRKHAQEEVLYSI